MKSRLTLWSIFSLITLLIVSSCRESPQTVIKKTSDKLNTYQRIAYDTEVEDVVKTRNQDKELTASIYFDFNSPDTLINTIFRFRSANVDRIYNGDSILIINHPLRQVVYEARPTKFSLQESYFTAYSLHSLRNLLSRLQKTNHADFTRVQDTLISDQKCFNLEIRLKNYWVDLLDGTMIPHQGSNPFYRLLIDKSEYLPVQFMRYLPDHNGYYRTSFSNVTEPESGPDGAWHLSAVDKNYLRISRAEYIDLLTGRRNLMANRSVPAFSLGDAINFPGKATDLSKPRKPMLLWFFYPDCEWCRSDIDSLRDLSEKGTDIFGIAFNYKDTASVKAFINHSKIRFPVYGDAEGKLLSTFGIMSAPSVVLIDTDRKLKFFSGNINEKAWADLRKILVDSNR